VENQQVQSKQSILKDKVILIVDDYKINTELISMIVADTGATSLSASNGSECIDIINKSHVDIILMDNNMPVMNGIEATKVIRSLPQGKKIIIIGITGHVDDKEKDCCLHAGMNTVVDKLTLNNDNLTEIAELFLKYPSCSEENIENCSVFSNASNRNAIEKSDCKEIMNFDKALKEFEGDKELLVSLIESFNTNIQLQLIEMRKSLVCADFESIQRESHGIKGGAANLCAMPLSNAAKSLEIACKHREEKETITNLFNDLASTVSSFGEFVQREILNKKFRTSHEIF
jgi:two-component system, sensor histidine kinase and response regulator